jgi:lipoprotein-anchoring transpeptidase ErfK/SrfK
MKRAGLVLPLLVACAVAGVFAALALAETPPTGTTTGTTTTAPTTTAPTETTTTGTTTTGATTTAPAPAPVFAPGVRIGGIDVGGLAPTDASLAVAQAFASPVVLHFNTTTITIAPELLGAAPALNRALSRARAAAPNTAVPLQVSVRRAPIAEFVAKLAQRFDRKPADARLFLRKYKPVVTRSKLGRKLDVKDATAQIAGALAANRRTPITLTATPIQPEVPARSFKSIVVIRRGSNSLYLYRGEKLVRQFGVATGQSVYPTPLGRFQIIVKWENPWWYPPNSDWAKGEKPVPPGPGNPLGTRWMGISSPGVGIHGTPDSASIGYSASHGCIRMLIPEAEWLFTHVDIGTPVFIVAA